MFCEWRILILVAVKLQKCFVDYETTSFLNPLRDFILVYMYFV